MQVDLLSLMPAGSLLTLRELEEGFFAVNDLEGAKGQDLCNVACVEPAVLVKHLICLLLLLHDNAHSMRDVACVSSAIIRRRDVSSFSTSFVLPC